MDARLAAAAVTHTATTRTSATRRALTATAAVLFLFLWAVPVTSATPVAAHPRAAAEPDGKGVRPGRPEAVNPTGTVTSAMPEFSWTRARDATGYELVIHQGSHRILTKRGIHKLTWSSRVPLPAGVDLTWRVRGLRHGKPGRYSLSQRFRIVLPDTAKAITAFSFQSLSPAAVGTIDETAHTIAVTVPAGTDRTHLVATFATTGASVSVGGVPQTSGVTTNDFTDPVTYRVAAADASTGDYVVTVSLSGGGPVKIGDSYQGGFVAYVLQPGDPGYVAGETHGLIVAEADLPDASWSTVTSRAVGTTSSGLGTGAANTAAIVGQPGCSGGAAVECEAYSGGGYDDWYLPSQAELEKVAEYSAMFDVFPAGVFYWSSTEDRSSTAVIVCINDRTHDTETKGSEAAVCPMRSF